VPYLKIHTPKLDFNDARHAGLSAETSKKIETFYQKHLPHMEPSLKNFGLHMKDAVNVVMGRNGKIHAVLKPEDDTTKPPLRPPPHRKWGFFWS
jgi:hypothetical protein